MKLRNVVVAAAFLCLASCAVSADDTAKPTWNITQGQRADGENIASKDGALLELKSGALDFPATWTIRFKAAAGDTLAVLAYPAGSDAKTVPMLDGRFVLGNSIAATLTARADGAAMATDIPSTRPWSQPNKKRENLAYTWRFPRVGNLWDERDRMEIGASYANVLPFDQKVFAARLVITPRSRQFWMDDRLVAETNGTPPGKIELVLRLTKTTTVLSSEISTPEEKGAFLPLQLAAYSQLAKANFNKGEVKELSAGKAKIPVLTAAKQPVDIDLGDSLYRYRLTKGTGPNAPYVNALTAWPGAFEVDPSMLAFRVPYRPYRNVYLVAWQDDETGAVAKGTLRFYRQDGGYPASTNFEISDAAQRSGLVTKLQQKNAEGKQLFLIKVPVDTSAFYGMRDLTECPLDLEISKPVQLMRSYPDPIYYGEHPAGPPSSLHVTAITLEKAGFDFEVQPAQFGHVFEKPEKPEYAIAVSNPGEKPLNATVTLSTKSYDGLEKETATGKVVVAPGQTGKVNLELNIQKNGWHQLETQVTANGETRKATLSLLSLPTNTRTYGNAANETRFGSWTLVGHYQPFDFANVANNAPVFAMYRKLGIRRLDMHGAITTHAMAKEQDLLPIGPHTIISVYHRLNENDPEAVKKMVEAELGQIAPTAVDWKDNSYLYGGEWGLSEGIQYGQWPLYTGEGDRDFTDEEKARILRQTKIFTAIGKAMREKFPDTKLFLQWGAPKGTLAFMRSGFPRELVDGYGMDAPMFELLPELSNVPGSINDLWTVRQEAKKAGWPQLPMAWVEGPFFPTNPGALTETEQADYQIRYWLAGIAYGIERFDAGVVPFDAGNYYGAEHYGAGVFYRKPLLNPKPSAAAIATATAMLCGSDFTSAIPTGNQTTYCMAFENATSHARTYALWRVYGRCDATIKIAGGSATLTDSMGNATILPAKNGTVTVTITQTPQWLTGVERIQSISLAAPRYEEKPTAISRTLADFGFANWTYDGKADPLYETNHFAVKRITSPNITAVFGASEVNYPDAVAISMPGENADGPLATRYGTLRANKPITIPGMPSALGVWIKGNSGWGRVVYQLRDAKGELWTSLGTRDDWNADDTHGWSHIGFEGWRYVRFPLPGNQPYDAARKLESTWWGSNDGDGIVDLPLSVEKIYVEERNAVPVLGEMQPVLNTTYKLSRLTAEYDKAEDMTEAAVREANRRMTQPQWTGPAENLIAALQQNGAGEGPVIQSFTEPGHFNDGRNMTIHFMELPGMTYKLYVSRYADGRGADLLRAGVKDNTIVSGFRPQTEMFLFLTATGSDKKESKPSPAYRLVTEDNFREK